MSPNALRLAWERIRRRAGCPDLHFHDLRHEAISRFLEMGLTTPDLASPSTELLFRPERAVRHAGKCRTAEELEDIPPSFRQAG